MAIISIPSSVGGVTIPGLQSNGPLGLLYNNPFTRQDLQYPRNLQSDIRGHVVQFQVNEIDPIKYEEVKGYFDKSKANVNNIVNNPTGFKDSLFSLGSKGIDYATSGKLAEDFALILRGRKTRNVATISLYIPDTMNFTYEASYGQTDLLSAASTIPLIGRAVAPVQQFLETPFVKLALRAGGYALNPNQQVLFDGIDFRTYQLLFTFTPYSKQEAAQVAKIIKTFKTHAAPKLVDGGGGMFFVPPSTFTPQFLFNGKKNTQINQVTESVLTRVDVNYSPNGFSTHGDGSPVQTVLTLDFKEIELITRQRIDQGF